MDYPKSVCEQFRLSLFKYALRKGANATHLNQVIQLEPDPLKAAEMREKLAGK